MNFSLFNPLFLVTVEFRILKISVMKINIDLVDQKSEFDRMENPSSWLVTKIISEFVPDNEVNILTIWTVQYDANGRPS